MNFDEYQEEATKTSICPKLYTSNSTEVSWVYPLIGLGGEGGEIFEKCKKVLRDNNGIVSDDLKPLLKKELGDVLWYISELSTQFGFKLSDVAQTNIEKLKDRRSRDVIKGSGDER